MITDAITTTARYRYDEVLVDLRLTEGGGFKVGSQHRRALRAALEVVESEIRAQVLEEIARELIAGCDPEVDPRIFDPWDVAELLRKKAQEERGEV